MKPSLQCLCVAALVTVAPCLSGCLTYAPLPLEDHASATDATMLVVSSADMPLRALQTHRFDLADGLDSTEVAMLAIANSPDLKVKRDELGIARAQAFAAGLLPDPQLTIGEDFPRHSGGGLSMAYSVGVTEDITALLTRSSHARVSRNQSNQVNLDLLWAEWQAIAQARLLFGEALSLRAQCALLDAEQVAMAGVQQYITAALNAGNLTYDTASAGLNAGTDVRKRLAETQIALHQAESDLRVLLGFAPGTLLDLTGDSYLPAATSGQIERALADLPQRRPDLLALQAGYQAQDAKLRGAILAQFPALTLGFNTARDTSAVYTKGLSIGITLPLFDRNRGNIAIESASRQRLKDDYEARLLSTRNDVQRLASDSITLVGQLQLLAEHARQLDDAREAADQAWQRGLLDWPTYVAVRGNALNADLGLIAVRQEQIKQALALETVLGDTDLRTTPSSSAQAPMP